MTAVQGFTGGAVVKNPPANAGDTGDSGSIPEWGRSPGAGMATCCSIPAWKIPWTEAQWAAVHEVAKSQTWLKTHTQTHTHTDMTAVWS